MPSGATPTTPPAALVTEVSQVLGIAVRDVRRMTGGDICRTYRADLDDETAVVIKTKPGAPSGFFAAEEQGLEFLRCPGGPPLPRVRARGEGFIVLEALRAGEPSAAAAAAFGRALADLHAQTPPSFGAEWPGFIGDLAMDNTPAPRWPDFFAGQRLLPYAVAARRAGNLSTEGYRDVEAVAGRLELLVPTEPPARLHGDLWAGNAFWGTDRVWLLDPAAHGGHRESDLAMLSLFGAPHLETILAAYDECRPLAQGWRERLALHQLFPLLVHAVLFGAGYGARAAAIAARLR